MKLSITNSKLILPKKEEYESIFDEKRNAFFIKVPNGELIYSANFFNEKISNRSMDYFLENENELKWRETNWRDFEKEKLQNIKFKNIEWTHDQIKMFGKTLFIPRYSAWYGDENMIYTYSGLKLIPKKWNKGLLFIKNEIEKIAATKFNSVLMNWYRDGQDSMGWHADDEKELGKNPIIASLNFGATRRFVLRKNDDKTEKIEFPLSHGSLLIMKGELQHYWQHSVPKENKIQEDRINLTFRVIKM